MQPCGPTVKQHNVYKLLQDYATNGCPVDCCSDCLHNQIMEVLCYGDYLSARQGEALKCLEEEALEKEREGFVHIYKWKDIKNKTKFKLSPVAMIPHKSRKYGAILDLSQCKQKITHKPLSMNKPSHKPQTMQWISWERRCNTS